MASALTLMKSGVRHMDLGHGGAGLVSAGIDAGIEFGAGYMLGQTYHRYQDKWYGKHAPRLAAALGKGGAVAVQLMTGGGANPLGGALNALGSAGLTAMGLELGLQHARKATGRKAVLLPAGAALPAGGATEITRVGALGQAAPGSGLSWDEIQELAAMH